jgi:hypothetical protein
MNIALEFLLDLFLSWLKLFSAPFTNYQLLWIIVPIYLNWIFTEVYQEKKGTSLGNAISNGFVPLWVGVDWGKTTYMMLQAGSIELNSIFWTKMIFSSLMIIYGIIIIILGIRVKKITHVLGKIRVVTYASLMFTPIFYGIVQLEWKILIGIAAFFPIFYFLIELIDRKLPDPKTYEDDEKMIQPKQMIQPTNQLNQMNQMNPINLSGPPNTNHQNFQNNNFRRV